MNFSVFDIECNGFLDEVTEVWCIVFKDVYTGNVHTYKKPTEAEIYEYLDTIDVLIGHNIIAFDIPILEKVYGIHYNGGVIDTLVCSSLWDSDIDKGHSLEAWGNRLGYPKTESPGFEVYSEEMVTYCQNDVEVTDKLYEKLAKELGFGTPHRSSDESTRETWSGIRFGAGT